MLNREDKKDVKNAMGKAVANKVSKATNDSVSRIKKAGSEYSEKHSLYSKKGFEANSAKNRAIHAKSGLRYRPDENPKKKGAYVSDEVDPKTGKYKNTY